LRAGVLNVDLDVILQVAPDCGDVGHHLDVEPAQRLGLADAGQHQQLWRIDRAAAGDHLAPGPHEPHHTALKVLDPDCSACLEHDPQRQAARQHLQIGPSHRWPQVGAHRAPAPAAQRGLVHRPETFLPIAVHVLRVRIPGLLGGLQERTKERIAHRRRGDGQRSALAVIRVRALQAVFGTDEIRQAMRVRPLLQAWPLRPAVVVEGMAADVNHAVDR